MAASFQEDRELEPAVLPSIMKKEKNYHKTGMKSRLTYGYDCVKYSCVNTLKPRGFVLQLKNDKKFIHCKLLSSRSFL